MKPAALALLEVLKTIASWSRKALKPLYFLCGIYTFTLVVGSIHQHLHERSLEKEEENLLFQFSEDSCRKTAKEEENLLDKSLRFDPEATLKAYTPKYRECCICYGNFGYVPLNMYLDPNRKGPTVQPCILHKDKDGNPELHSICCHDCVEQMMEKDHRERSCPICRTDLSNKNWSLWDVTETDTEHDILNVICENKKLQKRKEVEEKWESEKAKKLEILEEKKNKMTFWKKIRGTFFKKTFFVNSGLLLLGLKAIELNSEEDLAPLWRLIWCSCGFGALWILARNVRKILKPKNSLSDCISKCFHCFNK